MTVAVTNTASCKRSDTNGETVSVVIQKNTDTEKKNYTVSVLHHANLICTVIVLSGVKSAICISHI